MDLLKIRKDYTLFLRKLFSLILFFCVFYNISFAQKIVPAFYEDSVSFYIKDTVFVNKVIPKAFDDVIQLALQYYPELNKTNIHFRIKKTKSPLAARPTLWSIFRKPLKRKYIITISNKTNAKLTAILLENLSFNAKVGVIGHELAHISCYNSKKDVYFIGLAFKHFSKKAIDKAEFDTDKKCIEHGLGFQLLSWSSEVREKLELKQWGGSNSPNGKRERYMNPKTIENYINALSIYKIK